MILRTVVLSYQSINVKYVADVSFSFTKAYSKNEKH